MRVEYYDVSEPEEYERQKVLLEGLGGRRFFYPLVFIDGELKLAGTAETYEILHVLRDVLEPIGS